MSDFFNRGGISFRILLAFATPLVVIILALGYHFTSANMENARDKLNERGNFMAKQLAALSEFGVYAQDIGELRKNTESILRESDVAHITVENANGGTLVSMVNDDRLYEDKNLVVFRASVSRTGVTVTDYIDEDVNISQVSNEAIGQVTVFLTDADVVARQKGILLSGIAITTGGLLLGLLLALVVARSISGPIVRLTRTVGEITSGNLAIRMREGSPGELGALEQGINQMAGTLQGAHEQLINDVHQATAALKTTVVELERRNAELDQAREDAVRAGKAKSDFMARMSHEIRTPLSAVIGFAQLLEQAPQSENQVEYTRTITQAASQLLLIIDDILDFSRLDSGTLKLENLAFNLQENLENIVGILSPAAHSKHLELVLLIHSDVPQNILSDATRFSQVLTNLVANAIKFTDAGHVVINVSATAIKNESLSLQVAVSDTGIGLSDEQIRQIFDPFTQADVSTSRKYGGTGLGLSISRTLATLLGGSIKVDSTPGEGATFSFTLPVTRVAEQEQHAKLSNSIRVLVCDGNPFALRAIRNRFFSWGATVFSAASKDKTTRMLAESTHQPFDLLVVGLPAATYNKDSIQKITRTIRDISDIPLLLLVGAEVHTPPANNTDQDAVCVLSKPPRSDRMYRTVKQLLALVDEAQPAREKLPGSLGIRPRDALAGIRVMIAEDNPFNQTLFSHMLDAHGIKATLAGNGEEACKLAASTQYDVIFMDIHMPTMGGLEASRLIREGINQKTPIIALTADVFSDIGHRGNTGNLDDVLHKPVTDDGLIDMLLKWQRRSANSHKENSRQPVKMENKDLQSTIDILPPEFIDKLRLELATRLGVLGNSVASGVQADIDEQLHQLKGIVEFFNLAEFQTAFIQLKQAIESSQSAVILEKIEDMKTILSRTSAN